MEGGAEGGSQGGSAGQSTGSQPNKPVPQPKENAANLPAPEGGLTPEVSGPPEKNDTDPKNATGPGPANALLADAKQEGPHKALEDLAANSPKTEPAENLKKDYLDASKLGREVVGVVRYREDQRLTPFTDPRRFSREDFRAVQPRSSDMNLTKEDITNARRGSFSLALETAVQVAEAELPRTGGVREELDPLEALARIVKKGYSVGVELSQEDRQGMMDVAKAAIARRARVTPDKITWDDKKIESWAIEQFNVANVTVHNY